MRIIQKTMILEKEKYYEMHLKIINSLIPAPLSNMEIKVLAGFMSLSGDLVEVNRFNGAARKLVASQQSPPISSAGMSNYIKSLEQKGAIYYNIDNVLEIAKILVCENEEQFYQFKIKKK
jgi:hypothetical protein